MANIQERTTRTGKKRYDVKYQDDEGNHRTKTFARRRDAENFKTTTEADKLRGTFTNPNAGIEKFESRGDRWLADQTFDPATREAVELRLRLHVYPALGAKQLRQIRPSTIRAWLKGLEGLAPSYRRVIFANVSSIFATAVDDEELTKNPCRAPSVSVPRVEHRRVVPWPAERVHAVHEALPERYQPLVTLGAGLGLRQGEIFGLSPTDIDFLRGRVEVRRQVKLFADGTQVFAAPKGNKTRSVPLPSSVRDELAVYLSVFPARAVTLPWADRGGVPTEVPLVIVTREGGAVSRNYFNAKVWKPALRAAEVEPTRVNGTHALRHFFASVLLDGGESIRALSEYLGHTDPGFTLRTYTHLMPASEDRTRRAVDAALNAIPRPYRRTSTNTDAH